MGEDLSEGGDIIPIIFIQVRLVQITENTVRKSVVGARVTWRPMNQSNGESVKFMIWWGRF